MAAVTPEKSSIPVRSESPRPARWDPLDLFQEFQDDMARRWDQGWPFRPGWLERAFRRQIPGIQVWAPRIDIFEKGDHLIVKAELPGIKKEDMQISLDQDSLIIQGERKSESEVRDEDYYRCERSYGSFFRRLPLPVTPKAEQIEATFNNGVLEIRIPKPDEQKASAQRIPIS